MGQSFYNNNIYDRQYMLQSLAMTNGTRGRGRRQRSASQTGGKIGNKRVQAAHRRQLHSKRLAFLSGFGSFRSLGLV